MYITFLLCLFLLRTSTAMAETSEKVTGDIEATIHATADRWNSQDFATVLELWDTNEPTPFYLAEEQDDWFIGWEALRAYLDPPRPSPMIYGIREEMHNIKVNQIAPDLAMAAWDMHFEMKMGRSKPIGEDVRVSAILRQTPEGWRYIYWAESPLTATVYIRKLLEQNVDEEKFEEVYERAMKKRTESLE